MIDCLASEKDDWKIFWQCLLMPSSTIDYVCFWKEPEWPGRQTKTTCTLPLHPLSRNKVSALASHRRQNYQIHLDYKMKNKKIKYSSTKTYKVLTLLCPWVNPPWPLSPGSGCLKRQVSLTVDQLKIQNKFSSNLFTSLENIPGSSVVLVSRVWKETDIMAKTAS